MFIYSSLAQWCYDYLSQKCKRSQKINRHSPQRKNREDSSAKKKKMYDECVMLSMRFPQKLWKIVNDCRTGAIKWSLNGGTILLDYKKFQDEYLSAKNPIFKTNNITSFIRQLNLYGFRKVTSHNRDPVCNSNNPDIHEFLHENFRSGRSDLLAKVCRKAGNNKLRPVHRVGGTSRVIVNNDTKENRACDSPDGDLQRMTPLQVCQYALTLALEQARRDYHRQKVAEEVLRDEAAMELVNLENEVGAIWAQRYQLKSSMGNS